MNLQKREFKEDYDKAAFYSIMGEFFAEKKYRDEMPYLVNTEEKEWCLFFANGKLAGFYAHEERERHTAISGVYVLPAFRQYGVGTFMLEDMLRSFPTVRMVTSSPQAHRHAGRKRVSPPFPPGQLYYHGKLIPDYPYIQQRKQKRK